MAVDGTTLDVADTPDAKEMSLRGHVRGTVRPRLFERRGGLAPLSVRRKGARLEQLAFGPLRAGEQE